MAAGSYNWGVYVELLEMAKKHELKVQGVKGHGWLNLWWLGFFIFEFLWLLVFFCLGFIAEILLQWWQNFSGVICGSGVWVVARLLASGYG